MSKKDFSYLYNQDYYKFKDLNHFVKKEMGFKVLQNAVVLPYKDDNGNTGGGVVDENGIFIESSSVHTKYGYGYKYETAIEDDCAIYLGMFSECWGHCITDNIRRLWFLKTKEYIEYFGKYKLIYVPMEGRMGESFWSLLRIIGVDPDRITPVTEITKFGTIILPDESFYTIDGEVRYFTQEYIDTIDSVRNYAKEHYKQLSFNKVYFTYSNYKDGKTCGEKKLEQFFAAQGYEIIAPEKYSFEEQLNFLVNCTDFASTIGSCAHNMIFLNDGSSVILIPRAYYLTGYQMALDDVIDLNITYIDSSLSVLTSNVCPWWGPFCYFVSEKLLEYFNIEKKEDSTFWKDNLKDFTEYLHEKGKIKNLEERISPKFYYSEVLRYLKRYQRKDAIYLRRIRIRSKIDKAVLKTKIVLKNTGCEKK